VTVATERKSIQVKRKREVPIEATIEDKPVVVEIVGGDDAIAAEKAKIEASDTSVQNDGSSSIEEATGTYLSPENALAAQESKEKEAADAAEAMSGDVAVELKPKTRIIEETVTEIG